MLKRTLLLLIFSFIILYLLPVKILAAGIGEVCSGNRDCPDNSICELRSADNTYHCSAPLTGTNAVFGKIVAPESVEKLGIGSFGISKFLSMLINFIFAISTVILIFMLVISAMQWMLSGGNKDTVAAAQKRLTWAIVGMVILALAFAVANVVGVFTGFSFFK